MIYNSSEAVWVHPRSYFYFWEVDPMDPLDTMLTSLVDSAFPITGEKPDDLDCPLLLQLLNPIVYGQKEVEDNHDE